MKEIICIEVFVSLRAFAYKIQVRTPYIYIYICMKNMCVLVCHCKDVSIKDIVNEIIMSAQIFKSM